MGIDKESLTPTPHPDYGGCTAKEVQADIERIEEDLCFAKANGADLTFISWLETELAISLGELARRNGQPNFTSDYRNPLSEVKFEREINLGELQAKAIEKGETAVTFLPVLGQEKFIVKGWSHLLAAYPKTGKTELLVRLIAEWSDERILYVTEEPTGAWDARMQQLPRAYGHCNLFCGLGATQAEILERLRAG
jgi:hypothetical protein